MVAEAMDEDELGDWAAGRLQAWSASMENTWRSTTYVPLFHVQLLSVRELELFFRGLSHCEINGRCLVNFCSQKSECLTRRCVRV